MNVTYLSYSDLDGGAAIGAYRLHKGLGRVGVRSTMFVRMMVGSDPTVERLDRNALRSRIMERVRPRAARGLMRLQTSMQTTTRSLNMLPTWLAARINRSSADVVQLHWIGNDMISIRDLSHIRKPMVWRLADMWAFCGTEHYVEEDSSFRYREGYTGENRPAEDRGIDIERLVWREKYRYWRDIPFTIVTGSQWLAECARASKLMGKMRIEVIPNGIDTTLYKPVPKQVARDIFNLPRDRPLILFGAQNLGERRKGFHLLLDALKRLAAQDMDIELLTFGKKAEAMTDAVDFRITEYGKLHDDYSLCVAYSAADVMVVPSIQEAFGQTALEAMACGTPVVAFNATGLKDIVVHKTTGYLAEPYDPADFAAGIAWVLKERQRLSMGSLARRRVEEHFTIERQALGYKALYDELVAASSR